MLGMYVRANIKYSTDESKNSFYKSHDDGYVVAVDHAEEGNCGVANTFFAGLCAKLFEVPVRMCGGHSVKGNSGDGTSSINSGTGHAWCEVWDTKLGAWKICDVTSGDDPNVNDDETDGPAADVDGDEQDTGIEEKPKTDEELEKYRDQLEENAEKTSYSAEELELAEAANIEPKEAREIVKEINEALDHKIDGKLLIQHLEDMFTLVVAELKKSKPVKKGPLRKREGGGKVMRDKMVKWYIEGVKGNIPDPSVREYEATKEEKEDFFGGFNVYFIGDKSGSMGRGDNSLLAMQRKAIHLMLHSLHVNFQYKLNNNNIQPDKALTVETRVTSFRDEHEINEDLPLSAELHQLAKVTLWNSLSGGGGGNGDVAALSDTYRQIAEEVRQEKKEAEERGNEYRPKLRLVLPCSDGAPVRPAEVRAWAALIGRIGVDDKLLEFNEKGVLTEESQKMFTELVKKTNEQMVAERRGTTSKDIAVHDSPTIVVGMGLTTSANTVPDIYTSPYSRGVLVPNIDDLPIVVAEHLVGALIKLLPEKVRDKKRAELKDKLESLSKRSGVLGESTGE